MIEIKDVMKSFENKNVLNHLNVTISSGSIFGLIGPNGAGKSTLLYLLNGISKCDEGSILFDGKDVYENPDVKKHIYFNILYYLCQHKTFSNLLLLYHSTAFFALKKDVGINFPHSH